MTGRVASLDACGPLLNDANLRPNSLKSGLLNGSAVCCVISKLIDYGISFHERPTSLEEAEANWRLAIDVMHYNGYLSDTEVWDPTSLMKVSGSLGCSGGES